MPAITRPVMFNTPEADRILAALQVFPPDNPWNEDISRRPVHPNSKRLVASVGAEKPLAYNLDMGFILVPPDQKRVPVRIVDGYPDESDPGPFPVPDNAPIEDWPLDGKPLEVDPARGRGRPAHAGRRPGQPHALRVLPGARTDAGWTAAQASIFDLKSNKLRPDGWTSTDAAGLPIFPAVVRYDELERGDGRARHAVHDPEFAPGLRLPGDPLTPAARPT